MPKFHDAMRNVTIQTPGTALGLVTAFDVTPSAPFYL